MIGYTLLKKAAKGKVKILQSKILPDHDYGSICYN